MRRRLTTQLGWRLVRKCQRWVELSEVEARLWRDMEDWGTNHDRKTDGAGEDEWMRQHVNLARARDVRA